MNKQQFLEGLRRELSGLPRDELEERLSFYSEAIDDRVEEGLTEEAAVSEIGDIGKISSQIISETPLSKIVKEKMKRKKRLRGRNKALLIVGSPVWGALLIAAVAVVFSLFVALWSLTVALWAIFVALLAAAAGCFINAAVFIKVKRETAPALAFIGAGIALAGLSILLFFGCVAATKGAAALTKKTAGKIKSLFAGGDDGNE